MRCKLIMELVVLHVLLVALSSSVCAQTGKSDEIKKYIRDLGHQDRGMRFAAVHGLGNIGVDASEAVPILLGVLRKDKDRGVRVVTIGALGNIRLWSKNVIAELTRVLLNDKDDNVRSAAAQVLSDIAQTNIEVLPFLIKALTDKDKNVVYMAAGGLRRLGPKAKPAVPALIQSMKKARGDENRLIVYYEAARALLTISTPESREAVERYGPVDPWYEGD